MKMQVEIKKKTGFAWNTFSQVHSVKGVLPIHPAVSGVNFSNNCKYLRSEQRRRGTEHDTISKTSELLI